MIKLRTGYSFRKAIGTFDDYISLLKEAGEVYAPLTDRASTYGWIRWIKRCKKEGLKPVLGIELGVSPDPAAKKPIVDYWTFLPNGEDIAPLNRLASLATSQFRYQPLLNYQQAANADGVIAIMGSRTILEKLPEIGQDKTYYAALSPSVSPGYYREIEKRNIQWVASGDNYFPRKKDLGLYQVIAGRGAATQIWPQWWLSRDDWYKYMSHIPDGERVAALFRADSLLERATGSPVPTRLPAPNSEEKDLASLTLTGAFRRGLVPLSKTYRKRLAKELDMIQAKNFGDYFLIVADIVRWAKERMIVGPARGSAAGSLVCYLLEITDIDPIPHGLIFERFINVNRMDLPDIDIDFSYQQRHKVIEYIKETYGHHHVSQLGTVSVYKPRSALRETSGALRIPIWKTTDTLDSMIERSSGDARAMHTLEDTLAQIPAGKALLKQHPEITIATRMEGHPRHASTHASAVVLSASPLDNIAPVDARNNVLMLDKKDAEAMDLLKVDCLGLTQLSILEDALEYAKLPQDTLAKLPLDDESAFEVLERRQYSGIFQFNGPALQSLAVQFKMDRFDDIVAITALARPGPLASGNSNKWIKRRIGEEQVSYPHPIFEPYMKDTLGIIFYQEQVLEIGREVGGLSWPEVTKLRQVMSKSLGKEYFDRFGTPWKAGAQKRGVPKDVVDQLWDDMCAYGSWAFNKSHAVSYGLISYWCCWMKSNYPFEYAAATLNHENLIERQRELLRELVEEGYEYKPYDPETSGNRWSISRGDGTTKPKLVGPLQNIKGIGPKTSETILAARVRGDTLPPGIRKKLAAGITPLDDLYPIKAAIKRVCPDLRAANIVTVPTPIGDISIADKDFEVVVLCTPTKINIRHENEAVLIAKRGFERKSGPMESLNLRLTDDSGTVFGKVSRFYYDRLGRPIVKRGRAGKSLWCIKGTVKASKSFKILLVNRIMYLGDMDDK